MREKRIYLLFPAKTLTHIISISLYPVSTETVTHSLDEIRRQFLSREGHEIVSGTSDDRRSDADTRHHRICVTEFYLDTCDKIACGRCCWQVIKCWQNFEHTTADDTSTLPDAQDFTEIDSPLKFFFCCYDQFQALEI